VKKLTPTMVRALDLIAFAINRLQFRSSRLPELTPEGHGYNRARTARGLMERGLIERVSTSKVEGGFYTLTEGGQKYVKEHGLGKKGT
jgi:hypothetical protein